MRDIDLRFIILGMGNREWHDALLRYEAMYPDRLKVVLRSDNTMAHRIYAGVDTFLMPSKYEPCGLGQLIAMRYGTVPIVRKTGGLADTVRDIDEDTVNGTGFTFTEYTPEALFNAVAKAADIFSSPDHTRWSSIMKNCMCRDFSWKNSARKYEELYSHLAEKGRSRDLADTG